MSSFTFFFKAEDGIRDLTVTGVQTCALPISHSRSRSSPAPAPLWSVTTSTWSERWQAHERRLARLEATLRSEEGRVGKECRSRWGPLSYIKKINYSLTLQILITYRLTDYYA